VNPGDVVLARFELVDLAGRGGMGTVWRARDQLTGQMVAIKMLHLEGAYAAQRFRSEVAALAELSHPAIVRYLAHGCVMANGEPHSFLAMEWLDGTTLAERLQQGPLEVADALIIGRRAAAALAAAHAKDILHRDLKPENLVLVGGRADAIKLIDFGIAHHVVERRLTQTGFLVGTPQYVAPEQARGERSLGPPADLFSLGCVLFECLTGEVLFAAPNPLAVLSRIVFEEVPPLQEVAPWVPDTLAGLISRLLAKRPELRPASAAEVERDLAALADGLPAPTAGRPRRPALSRAELRVGCLVLVRDEELALARPSDETLHGAPAERLRRLNDLVEELGCRVRPLDQGAMALECAGRDVRDQARHAAQAALHVAAALPGALVAVVAGRSAEGTSDRGIEQAPLEQLAQRTPGRIWLDRTTADLIDDRFELEPATDGSLLIGERASRPHGFGAQFVGRERELSSLQAAYAECREEGAARATLITAPAGMGKSRLALELLQRLDCGDGPPARILMARADSQLAGAPFALVAPLVRGAAGIAPEEPAPAQRAKLQACLAGVLAGDRLARATEFLARLTGIDDPEAPGPALAAAVRDPRLMGESMRVAWLDWLAGECARGPVVLVLDDLHWGDMPSVRFVDVALGQLADQPLFVLALARPDVHTHFRRLWGDRLDLQISLGPLPPRAAERLARQLLGDGATEQALSGVVARAQGHPFILEQLARAQREGHGAPVPETILGIVQTRLDALGAEAKRVLRAASIFGDSFTTAGVEALVGAGALLAPAGTWLEELAEREVIVRPHRSGNRFAFAQTLLRDAAYAMLTPEDRVLGHGLAGNWLEAAGERDASLLASHYDRAGDGDRARTHYARAAASALEAADPERALALAERADGLGADGALLGQLRILQARAHYWRGEHAQAETRARQAMDLFLPASAPWLDAATEALGAAGQQGRYDEGAALTERVEPALDTTSPSPAALLFLGRAAGYLFDSDPTRAIRLLGRLERLAPLEPAAERERLYAQCRLAVNQGDEGAALALSMVLHRAFADAGDHPRSTLLQLTAAGLYVDVGQFEHARTILDDVESAIDRCGLGRSCMAVLLLLHRARVLSQLGLAEQARLQAAQARTLSLEQGEVRLAACGQLYLSIIARLAGDLPEAERTARQAIAESETMRPLQGSALASLAYALLLQGRATEARTAAEGSVRILDEVGLEEDESLARLVYAEALWATGDRDVACAALAEALQRLLTRADLIADSAIRASFLANVPDHARTLALATEWGIGDGR
jgi:tetratricopeptide (TPR) repeat protein